MSFYHFAIFHTNRVLFWNSRKSVILLKWQKCQHTYSEQSITLIHKICLSKSNRTKVDENNNEPDTKRLKLGDINDVNSIIDEKIKSQNTGFSRLRNELKRALIPDDYVDILQKNDQFIPTDPDKVW